MKKFLCLLLSAGLLAGCSAREESVSAVAKKKEVNKSNVWLKEPDMEYDSLTPLAPGEHGLLQVDTQAFGTVVVPLDTEATGYPARLSGYSPDLLITESDGSQGIMNYEGKELVAPDLSIMGSPFQAGIIAGLYQKETAYGITDTASGKTKILAKDGTSVTEVSSSDFVSEASGSGNAAPYLAVQNGKAGICGMTKDQAGNNKGWAFEAIDASLLKGRTVMTAVNDSCNPSGTVIFNPSDGSTVNVADGYKTGSFANGFYITSDGGHVTLVEAGSGQGVAVAYQDGKYMTDGYCAMEQNSRWGFVDGSGNEVTDFIFDDVTPLYDGKALVSFQGKYGILDVKGLLENGKQINMDTVTVGKQEKAVGEGTVKVSTLLIRSEPNTTSDILGVSAPGSVYNVYETSKDDSYTWYRIAPDAWVADSNGEWIDYKEK